MTLFNILYLLCLGGVVFSFSNIGISYLSNYLHSNLTHDFRFNFKVNDDDDKTDEDSLMRPSFERISVNNENRSRQPFSFGNNASKENVPSVIQGMREHLKNPEELQNIGNALEDTVTTILSNDLLRKAFVEDLRGISVEALHDLLKNKKTPRQNSDVTGSSKSD